MTRTDGERLVALETTVSSVQDDVREVKSLVTSLVVKVDSLAMALTKVEILEKEIMNLKADMVNLRGKNELKNTLLWVGLVASAIINVLVIYQLFTK